MRITAIDWWEVGYYFFCSECYSCYHILQHEVTFSRRGGCASHCHLQPPSPTGSQALSGAKVGPGLKENSYSKKHRGLRLKSLALLGPIQPEEK